MRNKKKLKVRKTVLKKRKNVKAGDDERRCCNIYDLNWNIFKRKTPIVQARVPSNDSDGLRPCRYDERYIVKPAYGMPIGKPVSNSSQEPYLAQPVRPVTPLPVVNAITRVSSNEYGPYMSKRGWGVKRTQKKTANRKQKKDNKRKKKYITRRPKRSQRVKKTRNNRKHKSRKR